MAHFFQKVVNSDLALTAREFLIAEPMDEAALDQCLSQSNKEYEQRYRLRFPDAQVVDLNQNPDVRPGMEQTCPLSHGLATSCLTYNREDSTATWQALRQFAGS